MFTITDSNRNIDQERWPSLTLDSALGNHENFASLLTSPTVYPAMLNDIPEAMVADFSASGLKALAAEPMFAKGNHSVYAYSCPRQGHAPEAIHNLCTKYGKKAVFFAAACKEPSYLQRRLWKLGADVRYFRVASMRNMNIEVKKWAERYDAGFIPPGFANLISISAGIASVAKQVIPEDPPEFWCAVSTGTMIRALQLAWPTSRAYGVAVARNIRPGDKGDATIYSYDRPFNAPARIQPPFWSTSCYDAKAWEVFTEKAGRGAVFINVAIDPEYVGPAIDRLPMPKNHDLPWGDKSAFERGP